MLAGSIPSSLPSDVYQKIMSNLTGKDILVAVDATGELLVNVLKYKPFLIKPNNLELGEIFGRVLKTDDEIKECAIQMQQMGARNVLVSMAKDGAILLDEIGAFHKIGTAKGTIVNSVGAGDSMVAGFLAGYLQKGDYEWALRMGTATGGATTYSKGLATKDKVEELLKTL